MKILLISLNQQDVEECKIAPTDISTLGIRYLSSYLKASGYSVDVLFLCKYFGEKETEDEINQILEFIEKNNYDLIGFGLMSNHFFRAVDITRAIKSKFNKLPILWGGIHPTIKPKECLEFADFVCVGEGELAMKKLLDNFDSFKNSAIEGIWYKDDGKIIEGGHGPLICDINSLPHPDYDLSTQYVIHEGRLVVFTDEILKQYYPFSRGDHRLISSRGCPHACAYCCSSVFRKLYSGVYLRRRSVDDFVAEMAEIKNRFSFVRFFKIMDDSFSSNSIDWLRDFNKQYKEKVDLPFYCLVSPRTIDEEKLLLLMDAGLNLIQTGLQSGSDRTNSEVYLRPNKAKEFLEAIKLFEKFRNRLDFIIDVIVDNPYETEADMIQTINVLNQIKKPYKQAMYSLAIYPGTHLYERATADHLLADNNEYLSKQFHLLKNNQLNKIIYLTARLPSQRIDKLLENRHRLGARLYIDALHFAYTKKNKLPPKLLKFLSKLLKRFIIK